MKESENIPSVFTCNPVHLMSEKEFDDVLLKFGSLCSILKNKRVNQTMFLLILLEDANFMKCFKEVSEIEDEYIIIHNLVMRFPILHKSKIIKTKIAELYNDVPRKRML